MPNIEDFIASVQGYEYFAILDLSQGYYQIPIPESERAKTAFVTPVGKYEFKRLPMGLADAPCFFQDLMNRMIGDLRIDCAQVYFDDILVKGRAPQELIANFRKVLNRLWKFGLKVKWQKCSLGAEKLIYLGNEITGKSVRPDPRRAESKE